MRALILLCVLVATACATAPVGAPPESTSAGRAAPTASAVLPAGSSGERSIDDRESSRLRAAVDAAVEASVARRELAGAVVGVAVHGEVAVLAAYGATSFDADAGPMPVDARFDLASLTKPLVTATSIHALAEDRRLRIDERASRYLSELAGTQLADVTVAELLLHTSGLPADDPIDDYRDGLEGAVKRIATRQLAHAPGEAFVYSDVGYVLLGAIVERVSGAPLDRFFDARFARPLHLEGGFRLPETARDKVIATASDVPRGIVHDPRARAAGGVLGDAGWFATANDVLTLARMLLGRGEVDGARVLEASTVLAMTRAVRVPGGARTLGFDASTGYSGERGALGEGFGHTGFTGTSLWVEPARGVAVVVLASRLQLGASGDVRALRRDVADAVARALDASKVETGVDVLEAKNFQGLVGKRIGLVTNASGVDAKGRRDVDVMRAAGVDVRVLFAPEHGLASDVEGGGTTTKDRSTGLPIRSLYGAHARPSDDDMSGLDAIVVDLQDAGARFYTYETTLGLVLESAAKNDVRVVVLDRPNPLGGDVEGPTLDEGKESFIAYARVPIRHGMTMGELARMFAKERAPTVKLDVVAMQGWSRAMRFADTGVRWVAPSPNLRTPDEALLYPGVALVEATNVSVGRGTDTPFELVGAPWIDARAFVSSIEKEGLEGVRIEAASFTPASAPYAGERCFGARFVVTNARALRSVKLGVAIAKALVGLHRPELREKGLGLLIGNAQTTDAILRGDALASIEATWAFDERAFRERRASSLIYP